MVRRSSGDRLGAAWRALAGDRTDEGWRTIPIDLDAPCRLLAGRHFPGNEEAVLIGFQSLRMPPESQLPHGRGFRVGRVAREALGGTHAWLSLSRQPAGNLAMFAMMAGDVLGLLEDCSAVGENRLFQMILGRIRAWQEFMERGRDGLLGPEAEVGLFGEIVALGQLLEAGMPATLALEAWQGPLDGIQDFMIGTGAIEVKTTIAAGGFPATIGSLEQLDDSLKRPLFLMAVRLSLDGTGATLPEIVATLRGLLHATPSALATFENRLLQAGFLDGLSDHYCRRFSLVGTGVLPVDDRFPKLTRCNVGIEIRSVRYDLDLDLVDVSDVGLRRALEQLGGI